MEGMARAVGAGTIIDFEGKSYVLNGVTLEDYGILRNFLLEQKRQSKIDFVLRLKGRIPDDVFAKHLDRAIEDGASMTDVKDEELDAWMQTVDGSARALWLCLNSRYPDDPQLTYQNILKVLQRDLDKMGELNAKRDAATGVDKAGNSHGLDAAAADGEPADAAFIGTN